MEWRSTEQKVESEEGEEDWLDVAARRRTSQTRRQWGPVKSGQVRSGLGRTWEVGRNLTHVRTGQAGCDGSNAARQLGGGGRWWTVGGRAGRRHMHRTIETS